MMYEQKERHGLFKVGSIRCGTGLSVVTWADKNDILNFPLQGINQIVGNTPIENIEVKDFGHCKLYFTDCWSNGNMAINPEDRKYLVMNFNNN